MRSLLLAALLALVGSAPLAGQSTAQVRVSENVRREPNGEVLARVEPGATFDVLDREDRWLKVAIKGWIWERSLLATEREGFDFIVGEAQGENLRDAPSGTILGRLGRGTLLVEIGRRPGWVQVLREAWLWAESVVETAQMGSETGSASEDTPPAALPGGFVSIGGQGASLLSAPGGDTLARTVAGADLQVMSREGDWARVRVEGWAWLPEGSAAGPDATDGVTPLTPQDLVEAPTSHRGRVVAWELQFISLERAEKVRTDFFEGEPFLLTRFGGAEGPFVYVALASDRVPEFEGLVPLERLRVTARVRTGASSLTGTPIVDLVSLERVRAPR